MNMNLLRNDLAVVIILLLAISSITPTVFGYNLRKINNETSLKTFNYDRYDLPEFYDYNNVDKLPDYEKNICIEYTNNENTKSDEVINPVWPTQPLNAPIDSVWPTHCHDVRHTGRSPYSTVDTWERIWKIETRGWAQGGPVIDKDKVIYIGAYRLYAVYPNGTLKWEYTPSGNIMSCPTIDDNGVIYFGTTYGTDYLYALYSNGTLKWKYNPSGDIFSSPVIGDEVIYFGSGGGYPPTGRINALYSNGTLKWKFDTNHVVYSSPAIGQDGTVYCGSHDNNVYALYPNNGTLKWKFTTGSWVHGSPTVADDGTVYIGSDDGYLYAIYPNNGTLKWKCNVGCIRASPALDENGILYVGVWEKKFYAIYPNGTIKWVFYPGAKIWGSSAALSGDGTLYFGTCDLESSGGIEIIALYTDGTVKWRKSLDTVFSSPAIGIDGTVYIGSCGEPGLGFLNAFGVGE
jgi:large repetitive protein